MKDLDLPPSSTILFTIISLSTSTPISSILFNISGKLCISITAVTIVFLPFSGFIDDFVLPPEIRDKESRIIDFPAPVSPVKTDSPF